MKITLCLSIKFHQEMLNIKTQLINLGHHVETVEFRDENNVELSFEKYQKLFLNASEEWRQTEKTNAMKRHFEKIANTDGVLVLNYDKNGIANYIGANTLIEMGVAMSLNKKIFLYNDIPDLDYTDEISGMNSIVIHTNLTLIN